MNVESVQTVLSFGLNLESLGLNLQALLGSLIGYDTSVEAY